MKTTQARLARNYAQLCANIDRIERDAAARRERIATQSGWRSCMGCIVAAFTWFFASRKDWRGMRTGVGFRIDQ